MTSPKHTVIQPNPRFRENPARQLASLKKRSAAEISDTGFPKNLSAPDPPASARIPPSTFLFLPLQLSNNRQATTRQTRQELPPPTAQLSHASEPANPFSTGRQSLNPELRDEFSHRRQQRRPRRWRISTVRPRRCQRRSSKKCHMGWRAPPAAVDNAPPRRPARPAPRGRQPPWGLRP